jgi:hypothetical protein
LLQASCHKPVESSNIQAAEPAVETELGPQIMFEKIEHDFGRVGPGTKNLCQFEFKNTGNSLLQIKNVSKTCGICTPSTLAKKEYRPGETGVLKVSYNADQRPGPASKTLFVYSNDKKKPKIAIRIKANIVPKVSSSPTIINLSLNQENAGCSEITLRSTDDKPFAIKSFLSTAGVITAETDPSKMATEFVLQPRVDMEKLQGSPNGRVTINLSRPECKAIIIPFNSLAWFKTEPASIVLLKAEPNSPAERHIYVLSNYSIDFEIESASSRKGFVKVVGRKKIGTRYKLDLQITPPQRDDENVRHFMDVLVVKIKDADELRIPCRGFYAKKN